MKKLELDNYKKLEGIGIEDGWEIKSVTESARLYRIELIKDGYIPIKWKLQRYPSPDGEWFLETEDTCYPMYDYELSLGGLLFAMERELEEVSKMRWIRSGNGVILG
jgi:hypothetical protein